MKDWISWPLVVGLLLGAALLLVTRNLLLIPAAVLLAILPGILAGWWKAREALKAHYAQPLRLEWADRPSLSLEGKAGEMDAELQSLGYLPAGFLVGTAPEERVAHVYTHQHLPIYAFIEIARDGRGQYHAAPQLETFLEGGGRLSTTASPYFGRFTAGIPSEAPRLVELRAWGPGTPTALDGQHVGTLKAWTAGKRRALPATREALIGYLSEDHQRIRGSLQSVGWLPLGVYLKALFGTPKGILKF
jgi:hypothetical protein